MKLVREHINEKFTEDSDPIHDMGIGLINKIEKWLKEMNIVNYTLNKDLSIDVNTHVNLNDKLEGNIPKYIKFNFIKGYFNISYCGLTTLRGCPDKIFSWFSCQNNNLTSLIDGPKEIMLIKSISIHSNGYACFNNKLKSLKGLPKVINGSLWCGFNSKQFTGKYVKSISDVKGNIITAGGF